MTPTRTAPALALGDDALILSHRLGEWMVTVPDPPALEAGAVKKK